MALNAKIICKHFHSVLMSSEALRSFNVNTGVQCLVQGEPRQTCCRLFKTHTHLGDDHFLVGSIEANEPLAHIENHGTHHPLPRLEKGKCCEMWNETSVRK